MPQVTLHVDQDDQSSHAQLTENDSLCCIEMNLHKTDILLLENKLNSLPAVHDPQFTCDISLLSPLHAAPREAGGGRRRSVRAGVRAGVGVG